MANGSKPRWSWPLNQRIRMAVVAKATTPADDTVKVGEEPKKKPGKAKGKAKQGWLIKPDRSRALDTDFLVCSPYKFFGPHLGLLYGKSERLEQLASYRVRPAPDSGSGKWETGTLPGESVAGLVGTFAYLEWLGRRFGGVTPAGTRRNALRAAMGIVRATERELAFRALAALQSVPGLKLRGIVDPARLDERVPTFAFTLAGKTPHEVAVDLGRRGIAVWDGDYYAYELIRNLGLAESGGMVRVGFAHYNEPEEVDRLAQALREIGEKTPPHRTTHS